MNKNDTKPKRDTKEGNEKGIQETLYDGKKDENN